MMKSSMRVGSSVMSTLASKAMIPPVARLIAHLRTPLYRNGYALMLSSTTTSVLGVVYWIVAARGYPPDIVGLNAAAIAAMTFLAGVSQLHLTSALNRFIPGAGRATGRLVVCAYLASVATALAASLVFVAGVDAWAPALGFLRSSAVAILLFTMATMAWCIFVLQDSVLTGLRQATWVPVGNTVFAVAKIALLLLFAAAFPQYGVFASWTLPLAVVLLPTNLLIFRRLIPRHVRATENQATPPAVGQIARYAAGDYLGSLLWQASITLLPVIVAQQAGATANAYFYLSWTIVASLYNVSRNLGASLIVEAATDQTNLGSYSYRVFVQTARLLVPLVAIVVLGAPSILRVFGESYAAEGATLLRLLALSALPDIVTAIAISIARVQRRMAAVVAMQASLSALVLALSAILLGRYGITGVGLAWLIGQSVVAAVVVLTQFGTLWLSHLDLRALLRLLAGPRGVWWRWRNRRHLAGARALVPAILPRIPPPADAPPPASWAVQRLVPTVNELTVVTLGPPERPPAAVLKLPRSDAAVTNVRRQGMVLATLQADPCLGAWHALLPKRLAEGEIAGQVYAVEQVLPGVDARQVLSDPATRARLLGAAAAAIGLLHRRTTAAVVVDAGILERWVERPLRLVRGVTAARPGAGGGRRAIERLAAELRDALAGRTLAVSWVHGDFAPGNILATPDGATLTGIVDWESARPADLPLLDLLQLLLSTRMSVQGRELGDVVRALLDGSEWSPDEQALLDAARSALPGDAVEMRALVLLCWLRHVAANLAKSTHYAGHRLWVAKNIETVLLSVYLSARWRDQSRGGHDEVVA